VITDLSKSRSFHFLNLSSSDLFPLDDIHRAKYGDHTAILFPTQIASNVEILNEHVRDNAMDWVFHSKPRNIQAFDSTYHASPLELYPDAYFPGSVLLASRQPAGPQPNLIDAIKTIMYPRDTNRHIKIKPI
jgi:hypothetical protein